MSDLYERLNDEQWQKLNKEIAHEIQTHKKRAQRILSEYLEDLDEGYADVEYFRQRLVKECGYSKEEAEEAIKED